MLSDIFSSIKPIGMKLVPMLMSLSYSLSFFACDRMYAFTTHFFHSSHLLHTQMCVNVLDMVGVWPLLLCVNSTIEINSLDF